jgi:class 3 adenylate cyclase/pimeloyl-ACP methyl ester carboxylesterase
VPYRTDGAGPGQVLIVSDWGNPYGEPGMHAYDAFVSELAERGIQSVLTLDGTLGAASQGAATETRIAAARAVSEAAQLQDATLLGVAGGAPVAAMLASDAPAFARLILYDSFPEADRASWPLDVSEKIGPDLHELKDLESQIKTATSAFEWARGLWDETKGHRGGGARSQPPPPPSRRRDSPVPSPPFAPGPTLAGGLGELLRNVASLEHLTHTGGGLPAVKIPALIVQTSGQGDLAARDPAPSLGIEIASRLPNARHRTVSGGSRWPWAHEAPGIDLLNGGDTSSDRLTVQQDRQPGGTVAERVLATVLFTDIVGSTERLSELGDAAWRELLAQHHATVREELAVHGGHEIDTAGDGFLAAFDTPAAGVRCAVAIRDGVQRIGLSVRCGLHTGECERVGDKLVGIAVHIGARIAGQATAGEILVSGTVRDLVTGAGISFADRGVVSLKGLPGEWQLFAVAGVAPR